MSCLTKIFYSHNHSNVTQEMAGSQNDSFGHSRYIKIPGILVLNSELRERHYDFRQVLAVARLLLKQRMSIYAQIIL